MGRVAPRGSSMICPWCSSFQISNLNGLFYLTESTEVCNFADDTISFACDKSLNSLIKRLEHDSLLEIEWFQNINMKLNQDKHHLLVSDYKNENVWGQIGDEIIWESKLLGLQIDRKLNFECVFMMQRTLSSWKIITLHEH